MLAFAQTTGRQIDPSQLIIAKGEDVKLALMVPDKAFDFRKQRKRLVDKYGRKKAQFVLLIEVLFDAYYDEDWDDNDDFERVRKYINKKGIGEPFRPKGQEKRKFGEERIYFPKGTTPLDMVCEILHGELRYQAKKKAKRFRNFCDLEDEILAEFEEEVLRLMQTDPPDGRHITFYERLNASYNSRAVDVFRREWGHETKNKKRLEKSESTVHLDGLEEEFQRNRIESFAVHNDPTAEEVTGKETIRELLEGVILTEDEKDVLRYRLNNPDAKLREIGDTFGYGKDKANRLLKSLQSKFIRYFGNGSE